MEKTNGHELVVFLFVKQLNNVKHDGMNGLTQELKKLSGIKKKMKNYCILQNLCQHNGEQLPL